MNEVLVSLTSAFFGGGLVSAIFDYFRKRGLDKLIKKKMSIEVERQRLELERARRENDAELRKFDEQQKKQQNEILRQGDLLKTLYEAIQHNLTVFEYDHLKHLESDAPGYKFNRFLPLEMIRLYQHGFVEEVYSGATGEMEKKGDNQFNLKEFYRITSKGKEHIQLIEKLRVSYTTV